ncbi:hypothetical protein K438DRAFT_1824456 [Mycena galopus ATCC 62051]|nr:hypothetical protein K438DRAFT_1824456 [Mycena galopus ATCC 62051]
MTLACSLSTANLDMYLSSVCLLLSFKPSLAELPASSSLGIQHGTLVSISMLRRDARDEAMNLGCEGTMRRDCTAYDCPSRDHDRVHPHPQALCVQSSRMPSREVKDTRPLRWCMHVILMLVHHTVPMPSLSSSLLCAPSMLTPSYSPLITPRHVSSRRVVLSAYLLRPAHLHRMVRCAAVRAIPTYRSAPSSFLPGCIHSADKKGIATLSILLAPRLGSLDFYFFLYSHTRRARGGQRRTMLDLASAAGRQRFATASAGASAAGAAGAGAGARGGERRRGGRAWAGRECAFRVLPSPKLVRVRVACE